MGTESEPLKKGSNSITMTHLSTELNKIAKLLDRSRPQVVVVVGTGVAKNVTGQPHADWLGLLTWHPRSCRNRLLHEELRR